MMMTKQEFLRIAREMRALQKEWFSTRPENRPPDLIGRAKAAEKRFDRAIEEFSDDQGMLFEGESG